MNSKQRERRFFSQIAMTILMLSLIVIAPPPQAAADASSLPWLHVEGNRIVDDSGMSVNLRGVAIDEQCYDSLHANEGHRFDEADMVNLVQNWHVNVIRVVIQPGMWQSCSNYLETILDPIVNWGNKYGVYILLGWHAHGNPITGETDLISEVYGRKQDPNMTLAGSFWNATAEHYRNDPWVIYSIFNEPYNITWSDWRPLAEQLVDVVRSHNPKALILVPGVVWAYDLRSIGQNPVQRQNIVYEVHVYPGGEYWFGPWDQWFGYLANYYPVFAGEWGFQPGSSNPSLGGTAENFGKQLVSYMAQENMSWTAFCWSLRWAPLMLDSSLQPTEYGQFVESAITSGSSWTYLPSSGVTSYNGASIDTAQSNFGGASGEFVASSGSYLSVTDSSDWYFGTGDFTIDLWVQFNSLPASGKNMYFVSQGSWPDEWCFGINGATPTTYTILFRVWVSGGLAINVGTKPGVPLSTNTRYHFAVVRHGSTFFLFVNGSQKNSYGNTPNEVPDESANLIIGQVNHDHYLDGWLDEVRVSKGIARWTSNFTPPAAPYAGDSSTVLLLHMDGANGSTTFINEVNTASWLLVHRRS